VHTSLVFLNKTETQFWQDLTWPAMGTRDKLPLKHDRDMWAPLAYNIGVTYVFPICGKVSVGDSPGWKGRPQSLLSNVIASSGLFYTRVMEWEGEDQWRLVHIR